MAEWKNPRLAKETFKTLCRVLEKEDWKFDKDEEEMKISCGARGDDLSMDLNVTVDTDRMLIMLISPLPFKIEEDKRVDVAVAVSVANNRLVGGCFDYDITSGHVFFRMTSSFIDSKLSEEALKYMLFSSCTIIDAYNDKFLMLSKGVLTLEKFLSDEAK